MMFQVVIYPTSNHLLVPVHCYMIPVQYMTVVTLLLMSTAGIRDQERRKGSLHGPTVLYWCYSIILRMRGRISHTHLVL